MEKSWQRLSFLGTLLDIAGEREKKTEEGDVGDSASISSGRKKERKENFRTLSL